VKRAALRVIEGGGQGRGEAARGMTAPALAGPAARRTTAPALAGPAARRASAEAAVPRPAARRASAAPAPRPAARRENAAAPGRLGADRERGFVAGALTTAGAWFVEPAEPVPESPLGAPARPRTVVAVFGLAPGCGATVVARALAAELAARDASGTAAVACEVRTSGIPLATPAASRLARALEDLPRAATRAVGRLCLIEGADQLTLAESSRRVAPLVLDAGSASLGGAPASLADQTVLVASPAVEPALARVAAECLARVGAESIMVLNRARADGYPARPQSVGEIDGEPALAPCDPRFTESEFLRLPDSRLGAQLALGGREARGELGRAVATLADLCEGIT
jgi:hypothetical protein